MAESSSSLGTRRKGRATRVIDAPWLDEAAAKLQQQQQCVSQVGLRPHVPSAAVTAEAIGSQQQTVAAGGRYEQQRGQGMQEGHGHNRRQLLQQGGSAGSIGREDPVAAVLAQLQAEQVSKNT